MNWGSLENFLAMGGYAWFVWGSYGVTAAALALEVWLVTRRRRRIETELARIAQRKQEIR
jgi:heme exporter protein D